MSIVTHIKVIYKRVKKEQSLLLLLHVPILYTTIKLSFKEERSNLPRTSSIRNPYERSRKHEFLPDQRSSRAKILNDLNKNLILTINEWPEQQVELIAAGGKIIVF